MLLPFHLLGVSEAKTTGQGAQGRTGQGEWKHHIRPLLLLLFTGFPWLFELLVPGVPSQPNTQLVDFFIFLFFLFNSFLAVSAPAVR